MVRRAMNRVTTNACFENDKLSFRNGIMPNTLHTQRFISIYLSIIRAIIGLDKYTISKKYHTL